MTLVGVAGTAVLVAFRGGEGAGVGAVRRALRGVLANETAPAAAPAGVALARNATRANGTAPGKKSVSGLPDGGQAAPKPAGKTLPGHANETADHRASAAGGHCLCLFDIDRTLTGRQGDTCGGSNRVVGGVWDPAYGGGTLTLSALGRAGVSSTFCGGCKVGVISAGSGGGSGMRGQLAGRVLGGRAGHRWSGPSASSPLIVGCHDGRKASCARGILRYYERRGVRISRSDVYHFDDKASSVSSFRGSGMNAIQVSCHSRGSGSHGGCGATPGEVSRKDGVHYCR